MYYTLKNMVDRENKLHLMDMMINPEHLEVIQDEILPALEEIVFFDPTP